MREILLEIACLSLLFDGDVGTSGHIKSLVAHFLSGHNTDHQGRVRAHCSPPGPCLDLPESGFKGFSLWAWMSLDMIPQSLNTQGNDHVQ